MAKKEITLDYSLFTFYIFGMVSDFSLCFCWFFALKTWEAVFVCVSLLSVNIIRRIFCILYMLLVEKKYLPETKC